MSSREPLWFCHECNSEMRPLMVPDPVCASCRGSFVEKIENPSDDPREFAQPGDFGAEGLPPGIDNFLLSLQTLMDRGMTQRRSHSPRSNTDTSTSPSGLTFQVRSSVGPSRTVTFGGANTLDSNAGNTNSDGRGRPPTMSEFIRRGSDNTEGATITGPIMAQYLMALLGQRDPFSELLSRGMGENAAERGRMGDYVFNQEALDQIITQLMENSNANRPIPATEEIIEKLPREVLEVKSPTLEKDCAVCKEQFKLETEDPDEQVVVTLPCKHPFHEPCILPWLKSSGTCPVCRYALIAQPDSHHSPGSGPDSGSRRSQDSTGRPSSPARSTGPREASGLLQTLFGGYMGGDNDANNRSSGGGGNGSSSRHGRSSSDPPARSSGDHRNNFPGSWSDDLD